MADVAVGAGTYRAEAPSEAEAAMKKKTKKPVRTCCFCGRKSDKGMMREYLLDDKKPLWACTTLNYKLWDRCVKRITERRKWRAR